MSGELVKTENVLAQVQAEEIRFNSMMKMSDTLAKSGLIPSSLRQKPADILVILMMARELNLPAMQALNGINVIQGKPVVSPQLMLAMIRSKLPNSFVKIEEGQGFCKCSMARDIARKDEMYIVTWDMERATKMQLANKDNWIKQAATMLKWRAVADAARIVFPDIIMGMYTPEELDPSIIVNSDGEMVPQPAAGTPPPRRVDATVIPPKILSKPLDKVLHDYETNTKPFAEELTPYDIIIGHYKTLTKNFTDKDLLSRLTTMFGSSAQLKTMTKEDQLDVLSKIEGYQIVEE